MVGIALKAIHIPLLTLSHLDGLRQATPCALPAGVIHRPRRSECIIGIRVTQKKLQLVYDSFASMLYKYGVMQPLNPYHLGRPAFGRDTFALCQQALLLD